MTCNVYLLCKYYHLRSWDRLKILFFSLDVLLFLLNKLGFKFEKKYKNKISLPKKKKLILSYIQKSLRPKISTHGYNIRKVK